VEASHRSPHGPIEVRWERQGPRFTLRVHVPANTRATVELPADAAARVTESGLALEQARGVSLVRRAEQQVTLEIGSGRYDFAVER
jgi:alpha-L-rhamnosidase